MPRGGLQIAQPGHLSDSILKNYNRSIHAEDRAAWRAMMDRQPVRPQASWDARDFEGSIYYRELLLPLKARYAVVLPLAAPILAGYPGAVYVTRQEDDRDFTKTDIDHLMHVVRQFDKQMQSAHDARHAHAISKDSPLFARPSVHFVVVDRHLHPRPIGADFQGSDSRLRQQMIDAARKRAQHLDGTGQQMDRLTLPDEHGDIWTFRAATYRTYPALGEGAYTFFCLTPACHEWAAVRPQDFQADEELARMIPALKFMAEEFARAPTLVEISKQIELSPFHFHRRFTELLGLTPKQYMLQCQIHVAKTQLLSRGKELVQIARDCGFAHQSHFTSRFKQATGLTPTRWRRMMMERMRAMAK
jgi:AraC-like DNA-binding protein